MQMHVGYKPDLAGIYNDSTLIIWLRENLRTYLKFWDKGVGGHAPLTLHSYTSALRNLPAQAVPLLDLC